jgi:hypothetical protein
MRTFTDYVCNGGEIVRHGLLAVLSLVMVVLVGCGGTGQTVPLAPDTRTIPDPPKVRNAPRVAVVPFEDVRADKTAIGRHQHYVETNVDRFVPVEGSASEQVTKFVVNYLKGAGVPVIVVPEGSRPSPDTADVVLTGQIESYWNEAVKRFSSTELSSKNRLRIKLTNPDGYTTSATVAGEATTKVVNFSLADLEKLAGDALGQSLARYLADLTVVDRSFRPKRED